jgi:protein-L-isoaspartate(D-aspartate) O-methyltransferase
MSIQSPNADESIERRQKLIDGQLRTGGVNDAEVLAAFLAVPREDYVAGTSLTLAYSDGPQRARAGGANLLPPLMLARLLQALEITPGESVLDVAGGGYSGALLRAMGAKVDEIGADLVFPTTAARGGYGAILVNGGFERDPTSLTDLLAPGGRLAGVRLSQGGGRAVLIERGAVAVSAESVIFECSAPLIAAFAKPAAFAF